MIKSLLLILLRTRRICFCAAAAGLSIFVYQIYFKTILFVQSVNYQRQAVLLYFSGKQYNALQNIQNPKRTYVKENSGEP